MKNSRVSQRWMLTTLLPSTSRKYAFAANLLSLVIVCCSGPWGIADDSPIRFRVDSRLYASAIDPPPTTPLRHHISLLDGKPGELQAFDFAARGESGEPEGEVTIFDAARRRYVLLDLTRRLRMEMTWEDVAKLVAHAQVLALRETGLLHTAASGEFAEIVWKQPDRWVFTSPSLTYDAQVLAAPHKELAEHYQQFADAFARWNTVRHALPPQARIVLNEKIVSRDALPAVIVMTRREGDQPAVTQVSRHTYVWSWSAKDQQRVRLFEQAMTEYERVAPRDFLRPAPAATASRNAIPQGPGR